MRKLTSPAILAVLLSLSWFAFLTISPIAAQQEQLEQQVQQAPVAPPGQQPQQAQRPIVWEYQITAPAKLNAFGQQGWEAFAVTVEQGDSVVWLKRRVQ
jgi:hypothetical protein